MPTIKQFWKDNEIFYGIVESVFKVKYATQVFNEPIRTEGHDDGIRLYLKVVNELGPDQQTQAWIHQQSLEEKYSRHTIDGIRGFVRRYQAAYGELELLGKRYTERDKADTILRNLLCDSMRSLVQLIKTTYKNSTNPFTDVCDHLMAYYYEEQWSKNMELLTHPTARPRAVRSNIVTKMESDSEDSGVVEDRVVSYGQQQQFRKDDLRVSDAWWRDATPEEHEVLKQMLPTNQALVTTIPLVSQQAISKEIVSN